MKDALEQEAAAILAEISRLEEAAAMSETYNLKGVRG
jgi:hypothetical protein